MHIGDVERRGDLTELVGATARQGSLGCQHDLDIGTQHPRARDTALHLIEDTTDRSLRCIDLPLREPQQRQTRLRLPSAVAGQPVGILGFGEVAQQPVQLRLLVEGGAYGWLARELFARALHLGNGVGPCAVQRHDLSAVHEALPAIGHKVWLSRTSGSAPWSTPWPAYIEDLVAGLQGAAVDKPGNDGRDLAGGYRNDRLVQQRKTPNALAQFEQGLAPAKPAHRHQVAVTEPLADFGRLLEHCARTRRVPRLEAFQSDRNEQVAALRAIKVTIVDQLLGSGEPATAAGSISTAEQPEGQPERAPCAARHLAESQAFVVRAGPDFGALAGSAGEVGSEGQLLQVIEPEWRLLLRCQELFVGSAPCLPAELRATAFQRPSHRLRPTA